MQWHKRPALQLVVISLVMVGVLSLQQGFAHNVLNVWGGGDYAQVALGKNGPLEQVNELVNVQAQNCADMDVPIDWTYGVNQEEKNNMLNRFPISEEPWTYDMFGVYKNGRKYTELPIPPGNALTEATEYRELGGDANVNNLLGSMFGYNPNRFLGAFKMKYPDGMGVAPEYIHGDFYGLNVPTVRNGCIKAPNPRNANGAPGYEIAPGFVAMVVYADANSVSLHIGRHEYQNVAFANGMTCTRGCTGGYWIYLTGVRPKGNILAAYNSVKNDQQNAKADKNPIKLPMVRPGQSIAEAVGDSVKLVVIDNGPIIAPNASKFWKEPIKDFGPTQPPAPTNPAQPTQQPTQQPTPPSGQNESPTPPAEGNPCDGKGNYDSCQQGNAQGICFNNVCTCKPPDSATKCPTNLAFINPPPLLNGCSCQSGEEFCRFGDKNLFMCYTPNVPRVRITESATGKPRFVVTVSKSCTDPACVWILDTNNQPFTSMYWSNNGQQNSSTIASSAKDESSSNFTIFTLELSNTPNVFPGINLVREVTLVHGSRGITLHIPNP